MSDEDCDWRSHRSILIMIMTISKLSPGNAFVIGLCSQIVCVCGGGRKSKISALTGKVDGVSSSENSHSTLSGRWKEDGPNQGHIKHRLC